MPYECMVVSGAGIRTANAWPLLVTRIAPRLRLKAGRCRAIRCGSNLR
jgi:hypothetical protein